MSQALEIVLELIRANVVVGYYELCSGGGVGGVVLFVSVEFRYKRNAFFSLGWIDGWLGLEQWWPTILCGRSLCSKSSSSICVCCCSIFFLFKAFLFFNIAVVVTLR